MNSINMDKLFKEDILTVNIPVHGETDDYEVRITFGGFLEILRDQIKRTNNLSFREISRAAITGFNKDDVFISCSCFDFKYRFSYYATRNQITSGEPENRPSDITNPHDTLGSGCKHILLVLNNTSWILRVSRVISNYISYMEKHYQKMYADIIYPAIYGKEYEDPIQTNMFDDNSLSTDPVTIDAANNWRKDNTKFKPGNKLGVRFAPENKEDEDQITFDSTKENPDDEL